MTLIAVAHGLVLADSLRATENGFEHSTGKVHTYPHPVQMWSKRLGIKDLFYGYAGTGDEEVSKHAGRMALIGQLDLWRDRYKHVDELRLLNADSSFSILLFGLNGTFKLNVDSGAVELTYHAYMNVTCHAIGSGSEAFYKLFEEGDYTICPVRTFYGAFTMEPTAGGAVEVWQLPTEARGKKGRLRQLQVFPKKSLLESFQMMSKPRALHFKEESKEWLISAFQRSVKNSRSSSRTKTLPKPQKLLTSPSSS